MELHRLSALDLADRLKKREVSAVEVAEAHLARIRALDGQINAFLKVDEDWTLQSARKAQELLDRGEGGALTTFDDALAEKVKLLRFHGIDREAWNRFGKSGSQHYEVHHPGFKYNMMDIQAAMGLHQLQKLDRFIEERTARVSSSRPSRSRE